MKIYPSKARASAREDESRFALTLFCLIVFFISFISGPLALRTATADDVDKVALKAALKKYTSCTTECAESLAGQLFDEAVDNGLKVAGFMKTKENLPKKVKYATFYVFIKSLYQSGKKVVASNAACYSDCDKLNAEIVSLGRAGLLGPMMSGEGIDESSFTNARIIDAYTKYLKPVQLPAEERGQDWAKFISSLS